MGNIDTTPEDKVREVRKESEPQAEAKEIKESAQERLDCVRRAAEFGKTTLTIQTETPPNPCRRDIANLGRRGGK
jgi:hypothetical protein